LKTNSGDRRTLLERRATVEGELWAAETREQMSCERRLAAGGWPGTLREARARVSHLLVPWLTRQGMVLATSAEREEAAKILYSAARTNWLRHREADQ